MLTLHMSKESPGRVLEEHELPEGCAYVGPDSIFDAPDEWYIPRRHWPSLTVVEVGKEDGPKEGAVVTAPALISASHPEPPVRPVSEADAREVDIAGLSYKELKAMCRDLNLRTNGSAEALRQRIAALRGEG